jgi:D-alanine-D-alanine ligase-like ATP-grasp enzyme
MTTKSLNILCISRFFKGEAFLRAAKAAGNNVYLLTSSKLSKDKWPWESIDETFYMDEDKAGKWNMQHVVNGIAYKMRHTKYDVLVALDDFDVEAVAHLREHFRIPGMGETTCRHFRDKLAMRMKAAEAKIPIPAFTSLFHDNDIHQFCKTVPAPWLIKPRTAANAMGIVKCHTEADVWAAIEKLGDQRHHNLMEQFAPGHVYHVDGLNVDGEVVFARASQYLDTPMEVAQGGGIFRSQTVDFDSKDHKELMAINKKLMKAFGMNYSATHSEFIKSHQDGKFYFLETASRVGGANIAEMVEASSGVNLWAEWAKIEIAKFRGTPYKLPKIKDLHAGIIVSLSRYEHPDNSPFTDKEIVWRMEKAWHIGLIITSKNRDKISNLLADYSKRIAAEYHASLPPQAAPKH